MGINKDSIHMAYDEFVLLMTAFGAENVWLTSPSESYEKKSEDEIQIMWECCKLSLSEKKYLTENSGALEFKPEIYYILSECAASQTTFHMQINDGKNACIDVAYYKTGTGFIEVRNDREESILYLSVKSMADIYNRLDVFFHKKKKELKEIKIGKTVSVSMQDYYIIMAEINMEKKEKIKELFHSNLTDKEIDELIAAIKENGKSLLLSKSGGDVQAVFSGKETYWQIVSGNEENIILQIVDGQKIKEMIKDAAGGGMQS